MPVHNCDLVVWNATWRSVQTQLWCSSAPKEETRQTTLSNPNSNVLATTRCCWPHKPTRLQAIQETGRSLAGWGSIQPWREEDSLNSVLNYLPFKVCHFDPCCELKVSIKIKHVMNTVTPEIINTAVAGLHLCSLKSSFPWLLSSSEREWDVRSLGCILGNKKREHFKQSVFTYWLMFLYNLLISKFH